MRKLLCLGLVTIAALIFFYPFEHDTGLYRIQTALKSIGKSEAGYRRELTIKQQKLSQYEEIVQSITTQFENAAANAPVCPKTGRKIEIALDNDPRPELNAKCEALRAEIQEIEDKLNK